MPFKIDGTLYPDIEPPAELNNLSERVSFLARLCAAWDFGLLPDAEAVASHLFMAKISKNSQGANE